MREALPRLRPQQKRLLQHLPYISRDILICTRRPTCYHFQYYLDFILSTIEQLHWRATG